MSPEKMFQVKHELHCRQHKECEDYNVWRQVHQASYKELLSQVIAQAVYVPITKTMLINGRKQVVHGVLQSSYPPCTGKASATGQHPYMCESCHSEYQYLKGLLRKRQNAKLVHGERAFSSGMRSGYLNKAELAEKEAHKVKAHMELQKAHSHTMKTINAERTTDYWVKELERSCSNNDEVKFMTDCLDLFRKGASEHYPVQVAVLKTVVGQLRQGRNHHYCNIIKKVAKLYKNWLGSTHYGVLQVILQLIVHGNFCVTVLTSYECISHM
jgi:hypothetical protein